MNTGFRICKTCGCVKPLSEFYFRKDRNSYRNDCKQCQNEYGRKWKKEHPEQCREQRRRWVAEHFNERKEYKHKWCAEHHEQELERNRRWNTKHKDERKKCRCKWRAKHPEYDHEYRQTPQGKLVQKNYKHKRRAQTKGQKITLEEWTAIKEHQKYRCYWCKQKFPESKITMDHVIPLSKGGLHEASNIVAACRSCNLSKNNRIWSLV